MRYNNGMDLRMAKKAVTEIVHVTIIPRRNGSIALEYRFGRMNFAFTTLLIRPKYVSPSFFKSFNLQIIITSIHLRR